MIIKREIFDYILRAVAYECEASPDEVLRAGTTGNNGKEDAQTGKQLLLFVLDKLNFIHYDIMALFADYGYSMTRYLINKNITVLENRMRVDPRVKVVADNIILLSKIYNGKYIIKEFSQGYSSHS